MSSSKSKTLASGVSREDALAYIRSQEPLYVSASVGPPQGFEQDDELDELGPPPGLDKDLPLAVPLGAWSPDDAWLYSLPLAENISPLTWAPWMGMPCSWPAEPVFNAAGMSCQIQSYRNDDLPSASHAQKYRSTPLILAQGLSELEDEDANCVIYLRGIHRFGFNSESILRQHFEQYGHIKKVFFSNAHQKPAGSRNARVRIRPSSIALILMSNAEEVSKALSAGDIQDVNGVQITARKFVRKEVNEKSDKPYYEFLSVEAAPFIPAAERRKLSSKATPFGPETAGRKFNEQHECRIPSVSDVSDVSTAPSLNSLSSNESTVGDADGADSAPLSDGY
jgi:hypothetical protein